jgi:hypothetical protein
LARSMAPLQIVCILWGTKYPDLIIDRMRNAILRHTARDIRLVCITDRVRTLDPAIRQVPFPDFAGEFESLKKGCRLKLALFANGLLEPGLPTLYFDLDTAILGDVAGLAAQVERHPNAMHMLRNHYVPWWRLPMPLKRRLGPGRYYFGNSSVLGFYPERFHFVFDRFLAHLVAHRDQGVVLPKAKFFQTDERFISHSAGVMSRVFPQSLVEKFAEEYMAPFAWMEELRRHLPWVKARRDGQVAITFVGEGVKPEDIKGFRHGQIIRHKKLCVAWRHDRFADYFAGMERSDPVK